jgi:hypothetical protein
MTQNVFSHNPLKTLPYPPYSPDISLSDFCMFGRVKGALAGQEIPDENDYLEEVAENLILWAKANQKRDTSSAHQQKPRESGNFHVSYLPLMDRR